MNSRDGLCGVRTGSVKILVLFTHFHGHLVLAMNWRSGKFTFCTVFHVVVPAQCVKLSGRSVGCKMKFTCLWAFFKRKELRGCRVSRDWPVNSRDGPVNSRDGLAASGLAA